MYFIFIQKKILVDPFLFSFLGPVVRTPVRANPGLNLNPGFLMFLSKTLSPIISLFFLEYPITKRKVKRIKLNLLFKLL